MDGVDPERLEGFVTDACRTLGATAAVAETVASSLVAADLRGHGTHGVMRLPNYVDRARGGDIDPAATPEVRTPSATTAAVDGRCAFGQAVGRRAVEAAVELAGGGGHETGGPSERRSGGVAVVGIRNATHLGRLGEYAEYAATRGLLFVGGTSGTTQVVAPAGTARRRLSTNPVAFGVPTGGALEFPVVLDVATSQTAYGKIRERLRTGDPVNEGWTVTEDGRPVRDAAAVAEGEGALRPLGGAAAGHKGYGLSVVIELFAALVGDSEVVSQADRSGGNTAFFVVIDPSTFTTAGARDERLASLAAHLRDVEPAPGVSTGAAAADEVGLLPGEPEHRTAAQRRASGIPLRRGVAATLVETADELGLDDSLPEGVRDRAG